jgi:hypothetical protein
LASPLPGRIKSRSVPAFDSAQGLGAPVHYALCIMHFRSGVRRSSSGRSVNRSVGRHVRLRSGVRGQGSGAPAPFRQSPLPGRRRNSIGPRRSGVRGFRQGRSVRSDAAPHRAGAAPGKMQHRAALPLPELRGLRPHPVQTKTTAPRIPMWSPTMVLTERHSG